MNEYERYRKTLELLRNAILHYNDSVGKPETREYFLLLSTDDNVIKLITHNKIRNECLSVYIIVSMYEDITN